MWSHCCQLGRVKKTAGMVARVPGAFVFWRRIVSVEEACWRASLPHVNRQEEASDKSS